VDAKPSKAQTALFMATAQGQEAVARRLLENGADMGKIRNLDGSQFHHQNRDLPIEYIDK